jgi:DNA-binding CsgD family transcriptional regulator
MLVLAAVLSCFMTLELFIVRRRNENLKIARQRLLQESEDWRLKHSYFRRGFGEAIDQQFKLWNFTAAERDTALFLLKGLSSIDIAQYRNCSEKTVRQHCLKIYAKSGLKGRAELAAYFLEDLLAPTDAANEI